MAVYGINDGHTISGIGSGACGIINESQQTRIVGAEVRKLLTEQGNKVINCAVNYANSVTESLSKIMEQANRQDLDWFISLHFNAGGGQGVEAYTYGGRQYQDAIDVCSNISKLGFKNRGVKDGKGLYVIRRTKAKSLLIEICFVDTSDANHYLQVGYKAIAKAIVEALTGKTVSVSNTTPKQSIPQSKPTQPVQTNTGNDWIRRLQAECNRQGFSNQRVDGYYGENTVNGCPMMRQGTQGTITKLLQEKLNKLTYNTNGVDGIFGSTTFNAVSNYQSNHGLSRDGICGKDTWREIIKQ